MLVSSLNIQYCNQMELRRELCKRSGTDELHHLYDSGGMLTGLVHHQKHNHRFVVQEYVLGEYQRERRRHGMSSKC